MSRCVSIPHAIHSNLHYISYYCITLCCNLCCVDLCLCLSQCAVSAIGCRSRIPTERILRGQRQRQWHRAGGQPPQLQAGARGQPRADRGADRGAITERRRRQVALQIWNESPIFFSEDYSHTYITCAYRINILSLTIFVFCLCLNGDLTTSSPEEPVTGTKYYCSIRR